MPRGYRQPTIDNFEALGFNEESLKPVRISQSLSLLVCFLVMLHLCRFDDAKLLLSGAGIILKQGAQ